eukprot:CAMPEP_0182441804 /NCGR_PEP_ID=MMETSP1172-20130603/804_1 /TAXON_ID=708627 /ORGANISM="Timspurckia oligopyrenoides, Strain CCMP3278" /LENGTH=359 /DNA_ID=CAMNT_0024636353 /DNA_START=46 /DNA_END=1125 /DNA_ORIENTATION=-
MNFQSDDSIDDFGEMDVVFGSKKKSVKPKVVGHYLLGVKLGEGAHAKVKEGMDEQTLRIVAVKIVDKRFLAKMPGGLDNIQREIAILKALKNHQNIIQLLDVLDEPEKKKKLYIVMELANGCTVQELIERAPNSKVPLNQAKMLFRQLLIGLQYIHGHNIVHRDIKPANLMLTTEAKLKISDFGVAEFLNKYDAQVNVSRTSGSPAFQAPEIALGEKEYDGTKVDIWAAGVTLFYMLTGTVPFHGDTLFELFGSIGKAEFTIPEYVDPLARDLISHMMLRDQSQRYSARDCLNHPWIKPVTETGPEDDWVSIPLKEPQITKMVSALLGEDTIEEVSKETEIPTITEEKVSYLNSRCTLM